jgi:hypothetical protein
MHRPQQTYYFKLLSDPFMWKGFVSNDLLLLDTRGICLANQSDVYTNIELEINIESIREYKELTCDLIRYARLDIPEPDLEENGDTAYIIDIKRRREEIKAEWMKKYIVCMAWKRRRQLLAVWDKL